MLKQEESLRTYELLWDLQSLAASADDATKYMRLAQRTVSEFFEAESAVIVRLDPSRDPTVMEARYPKGAKWSIDGLRSLLESPLSEMPRRQIYGLLERRGRTSYALALAREADPFGLDELETLRRASTVISDRFARIDDRRVARVREKIGRKLIEPLQPRDLFYQILHGIRTLTRYDHSAALYIFTTPVGLADEHPSLDIRVVAELLKPQTKSPRVHATFELPRGCCSRLSADTISCWRREGDSWRSRSGEPDRGLPGVFDSGSELGDYGRERSMILAPLVGGETLLGVLKIAFSEPHMAGDYETGLVQAFQPDIIVALRNFDRFDHLRRELDAAREFQQRLLPLRDTRVGPATIVYRYRPCEQLGGDFFDVVHRGKGRVVILLTDVSGHGAQAAMPTAIIKAAFRDQADSCDPARILASIWKGLRFFESTLMVTALCLELDAGTGALRWANAGHPRPLVLTSGGEVEKLAGADTPIFPAIEGTWETHTRRLEAGSQLLGYTDGVIESEHEARELGEEGLEAVFRKAAGVAEGSPAARSEPGATLDRILRKLDQHRGKRDPEDDCTLFLLALEDSAP